MEVSPNILFPLLIAAPVVLCLLVLFLLVARNKRKKTYPFAIEQMLRMPGHSVLSQLIDESFNFAAFAMFAFFALLIPFAQVGFSYYMQSPITSIEVVIALSLGITAFALYKMIKSFNRRAQLRLGLEAEWAVGGQLQQLQNKNFRVFHDVQADGFNIDHLVVSNRGVFAIETKGRKKPINKTKNGKDKSFKVVVKGVLLEFPKWHDSQSVEQAIRQSQWVSSWLSHATGFEVKTSPVLIIPGWYIDTPEKPHIPVLPLGGLEKHFSQLYNANLGEQEITKICYQIEQRVKRGDDSL